MISGLAVKHKFNIGVLIVTKMASDTKKILLTGATGYIGGSVLTALLNSAEPVPQSAPITCLLRGADRAALLSSTYGVRVKPVLYRDLNDTETATAVAAQHDIVIHCTLGYHPVSALALVRSLAQPRASTGRGVPTCTSFCCWRYLSGKGHWQALPTGKKGILFSGSGRHSWLELAEEIANVGYEEGLLSDKTVARLSLEEAVKLTGLTMGAGPDGTAVGFWVYNTNARTLASVAARLGWAPSRGNVAWKGAIRHDVKAAAAAVGVQPLAWNCIKAEEGRWQH
jgi:regulator of extracellular matrix RemA (YlzA/DUF370 family)